MSDARAVAPAIELPVMLRRRQRAELARDVVDSGPAIAALLVAGAAGLRGGAHTVADRALALAEIGGSAWLLVLLLREARRAFGAARPAADGDAGAGHEIEWRGVAAAALLLVEVWQHWHQRGRVHGPFLLAAAVTLFISLGGRRVIRRHSPLRHRRPRLVVSADGIEYRASVLRRFDARWDQIARVEHAPDAVRVALHDGRTLDVRARDHVDGDRLVDGLRQALAVHAPAPLVGTGEPRPDAR